MNLIHQCFSVQNDLLLDMHACLHADWKSFKVHNLFGLQLQNGRGKKNLYYIQKCMKHVTEPHLKIQNHSL